ncbi:MAG: D-alanine--D-alanine ligase [Bacteroidota bacterium]
MSTIGIFCGGFSSEFEISLKSAKTILENFPDGHKVFLIKVEQEKWTAIYENQEYDFNPWDLNFSQNGKQIHLEVGLIYIHGNPGENGKLQAFLEMKNIPFINSGALASELSFDKWYCNQFLKSFNIPVAKSILLKKGYTNSEKEIIDDLDLPCFVKPADSGSSYGISKVKTPEELKPALDKAFQEGQTVVIESFLKGTEVTCGVYRSKEGIYALPLTEIATENDFFDYEAKYLGKSQEITPARVSDEVRIKVQDLAKKIYDLLNLRSIARIDFMIVENQAFVIEVNTTPGFSPASIVPQMIQVDGKTIKGFWEEILEVELKN